MYVLSKADLEPVRATVNGNSLVYQTIVVGQLQTNCTVLANETVGKALVVDPGDDAEAIAAVAKQWKVAIVGIYATHGHLDHILAAGSLKRLCPGSKLFIHRNDATWWNNVDKQLRAFGIRHSTLGDDAQLPAPDAWLDGSEQLDLVPGLNGRALFTPGHTGGSTSYYFADLGLVCTGDTLFKANVGRTDLMDGDFTLLAKSIRLQLYALPDSTKVVPGHGSFTSIDFEKKHNMYVPATAAGGDGDDDDDGVDKADDGGKVHPYFSSAVDVPHSGCCCLHAHHLAVQSHL